MKDQSQTIEFFTPTLGRTVAPYIAAKVKQGIHHVARYEWAAMVLRQLRARTILDIACGAGYGSSMLAQALPGAEVTGADYDERAVEHARQNYSGSNLKYMPGDLETWRSGTAPMGTYDAIVSFDTIEHLLHRDIALVRISDHLADGGVLLLSTPCAHSQTRLQPGWEHHKCEYSFHDLHALLSRFFRDVRHPYAPQFIGADYWINVVNRGERRYLNLMNPVICSQPIRIERFQKPAELS